MLSNANTAVPLLFAAQGLGLSEEDIKSLFGYFDVDGSGEIDFSEFRRFLQGGSPQTGLAVRCTHTYMCLLLTFSYFSFVFFLLSTMQVSVCVHRLRTEQGDFLISNTIRSSLFFLC